MPRCRYAPGASVSTPASGSSTSTQGACGAGSRRARSAGEALAQQFRRQFVESDATRLRLLLQALHKILRQLDRIRHEAERAVARPLLAPVRFGGDRTVIAVAGVPHLAGDL